jgi:eukaryotic-like serine/threonine-protein kinase
MIQALATGDPETVGKYRLVGRLGQGGMGQVYVGESPGGRRVAVKLIRAELAGDSEFRARFAREVATARTVGGIYTVPVVDACVDGPQPWLVTAYVEGPSLADAVHGYGPFGLGRVLALAAGLAEGLDVIHAAGVVHRDLKPSNVLLAQDGPRIIDFGISRAAESPDLTRSGLITGSPGYMSPEQAAGGVAGPASDVFSLGSVLAFASTAREPFGSGNWQSVLYRVVHSEPDTEGMPDPLRSLVARCLAKDPARRPTPGQIVAELGAARVPSAQPPVSSPVPHQPTVTSARTGRAGAGGPAGPALAPTQRAWPSAAGSPTLHQRGARREHRARGLAWTVTAVVAVVAAGGLTALALTRGQAKANQVTSTGAATSVSAVASPSGAAVTGWHTYTDPSGFSIKVPRGWSVTSTGKDEVDFTGPMPGYVILVEWTNAPESDAYTDWQQQAAAKAANDPTYQQIGIGRVSYRGWNAADWEFVNTVHGEKTHVLDRGFVVTPGTLGYAIEISGPPSGFAAARAALWTGLTTSFEPAS